MINLDKTILNQLISLGLSEKEANVYLTLVELGSAPVQDVAWISKINRSTTYTVLDNLIRKELIHKTENAAGVSVYEAYEPVTLVEKAASLEKAQLKTQKEIDLLIPELNALSQSLALSPRIKLYEGKAGFETAAHDVATSRDEIIRCFAADAKVDYSNSGRLVHIISPHTAKQPLRKTRASTHIRYIPSSKYVFTSTLCIYGDKVTLLSRQGEFGIIIENHNLAEIMKETFDLAWEEAGRLDKNIRKTSSKTFR